MDKENTIKYEKYKQNEKVPQQLLADMGIFLLNNYDDCFIKSQKLDISSNVGFKITQLWK
jgi:hypothetical protein